MTSFHFSQIKPAEQYEDYDQDNGEQSAAPNYSLRTTPIPFDLKTDNTFEIANTTKFSAAEGITTELSAQVPIRPYTSINLSHQHQLLNADTNESLHDTAPNGSIATTVMAHMHLDDQVTVGAGAIYGFTPNIFLRDIPDRLSPAVRVDIATDNLAAIAGGSINQATGGYTAHVKLANTQEDGLHGQLFAQSQKQYGQTADQFIHEHVAMGNIGTTIGLGRIGLIGQYQTTAFQDQTEHVDFREVEYGMYVDVNYGHPAFSTRLSYGQNQIMYDDGQQSLSGLDNRPQFGGSQLTFTAYGQNTDGTFQYSITTKLDTAAYQYASLPVIVENEDQSAAGYLTIEAMVTKRF